MKVHVLGTPTLLQDEMLHSATAVVIDALRMTSVAATAVANGCAGLYAVESVEAARECAAKWAALLGGERQALPIEGFDFANSPLDYTADRVQNRRLVMTTSNGTKAIAAAAGAQRLLLGAFINRAAVVEAVADAASLVIVCAGTLGAFTLEDALAAGAVLEGLCARGVELDEDDMALAARTLYEASQGDLHRLLSRTVHYRRLSSLGLAEDLAYCLQLDTVDAVPERGEDGWFRG